MHKKVLLTLIVIMLVLLNIPVCFATGETTTTSKYKVLLEDDANLLSLGEEEELKPLMNDLTQYGNIIFKTINKNSYSTSEKFARNYYYEKFGNNSGSIFLIDMHKRMVYIYSAGNNYKVITSAKAETITDNIYKYATKKQYYKCAKEALSQMKTLLEGGKIAEPMKNISNVVISLMVALFANFCIFKFVTKPKKASSGELLNTCEKFLEHTTPEVEQTGEHRVYSPVNTGGSSGGGGGGGRRWRRRPEVAGGGHSF